MNRTMRDIKDKNMKWWIGIGSTVGLFAVIALFTYFKMGFVIKGVQVEAILDHTSNSPLVWVKGNAKNAVYVSLNGREIFIDKDGSFNEQVALLPGLSVVTVNAEDKFGKSSEKKFEVVYTESTGSFAYNDKTKR